MPDDDSARPALVEIKELKVYFPILAGVFRRKIGEIKAVENVTFSIKSGETLGLVGESGCGKTTTGRAILRLGDITAGSIHVDGKDVVNASPGEMRTMRRKMQMIFQDPQASLNPRMTVADIIGEPFDEHQSLSRDEKHTMVCELMNAVGLAAGLADRYPHEFSGGQKQRIGIARALALKPKLVVCDEPIAALDVSIQAQVVNLLMDLQNRLDLTYLFISHDLGMVRYIADRVAVMHLGQIVELAMRDDLYGDPLHPYTEALLSAVPEADPQTERNRQRIILKGDLPSPSDPPKGCNFCTRCARALDICHIDEPQFEEVRPGRFVACHLYAHTRPERGPEPTHTAANHQP